MNRKIFREQNSTLTVLDACVLSLIMVRRLIKQWLVVVRKSHRRDLQYLRDSSRRRSAHQFHSGKWAPRKSAAALISTHAIHAAAAR